MASAPSNVLNRLHFNISCGNTFYVNLSVTCYRLVFVLTVVENFRFVVNVETKHRFEVDQEILNNSK